jgi:hypothetical protein
MNLNYSTYTSNVGMCVLRYVFQSWEDAVDYIISFEVGYDFAEFTVCNASDLRLNVVKIFGVVR